MLRSRAQRGVSKHEGGPCRMKRAIFPLGAGLLRWSRLCAGRPPGEPPRKDVGLSETEMPRAAEPDWPDRLFAVLKQADIRQVAYVPDAGHARLIELCAADPAIRDVVLTTEEEGSR
jgi:hypothetical protein